MANQLTGVLYIATGDEYIKEATKSAQSIKNNCKGINIALVTDHDVDTLSSAFDQIISVDSLPKTEAASNIKPEYSPFDKTIFLDTDTHVHNDITPLFTILNNHDIAVSHTTSGNSVPGLPNPWVEYNTGVVAYRDNKKTNEFLNQWQDEYAEMQDSNDTRRNQPSFTRAVAESDVSVFILPREYNARIPKFGKLLDEVKIVHGRSNESLHMIATRLNTDTGPRVYWPAYRLIGGSWTRFGYTVNKRSKSNFLSSPIYYPLPIINRFRQKGIIPTIKEILNKSLNK